MYGTVKWTLVPSCPEKTPVTWHSLMILLVHENSCLSPGNRCLPLWHTECSLCQHTWHITQWILQKKRKEKSIHYVYDAVHVCQWLDQRKFSLIQSKHFFFLLKIHVKCNWGHHTHTHPHIQSLLFRWPVAMCSWKSYLRLQRYTINGFKSTLPEPNVSLIEASK